MGVARTQACPGGLTDPLELGARDAAHVGAATSACRLPQVVRTGVHPDGASVPAHGMGHSNRTSCIAQCRPRPGSPVATANRAARSNPWPFVAGEGKTGRRPSSPATSQLAQRYRRRHAPPGANDSQRLRTNGRQLGKGHQPMCDVGHPATENVGGSPSIALRMRAGSECGPAPTARSERARAACGRPLPPSRRHALPPASRAMR